MAEFNIEMYGVFRRLARSNTLKLNTDAEQITVGTLLELLSRQHPEMSETLKSTAVAVGDELVSHDTILTQGQSLALIPPVSGG